MNKQSRRFHDLLKTIAELHDKKQHDYGADEDIFANFRLSELSGVPAWQGSVIRMGDKYSRISNFIKKGEFKFKEESIKDTLMDMAVYSLITMILFEEAEENEAEASTSTTEEKKEEVVMVGDRIEQAFGSPAIGSNYNCTKNN